jgi:hypothetical protein
MQRKRRVNALLLSICFSVLFIAGCENMPGLKKTKRIEVGKHRTLCCRMHLAIAGSFPV